MRGAEVAAASRRTTGMAPREVSQLCLERDAPTKSSRVRVRTGPVVHPDIPAEHAPFSTPISRTCTRICTASIFASRQSRYAWHDAFDVSGNISVAEALAAIFGKKWPPRVISQLHAAESQVSSNPRSH